MQSLGDVGGEGEFLAVLLEGTLVGGLITSFRNTLSTQIELRAFI